MGAWNVRTLLSDVDGSDGPRRRTALVALELERYNIDIAALSETRLSGEGSIVEGEGQGGYTIFWRGYPEGQIRMHGVGLAIRNSVLKSVTESPTYISERLMTLRVPLVKGEFMTIISAYAPTLAADEDIKDEFYSSLDQCLNETNKNDKIILLGDFNARVGKRSDIWRGVLGRHGVGNMNANGLRLLSLCSEHNLLITNTAFRLKDKYKTTWMHPRSKQWHLIDYVIVRQVQQMETLSTRVMRGADCWTDHRLVMSKMMLKIRPRIRLCNSRPKKINLSALQVEGKENELQQRNVVMIDGLQQISNCDPNTMWDHIAAGLMDNASHVLGHQTRKNRDWFQENNAEIRKLLREKNAAHGACLRNPSSVALRQKFSQLRSITQKKLREIENNWWLTLSREIQGYADTNNMHEFYDAVKRLYGPTSRAIVPVRSEDGSALIRDKNGILSRWAEHFDLLLNHETTTDPAILDELPDMTILAELDLPPSYDEVVACIKSLKNNKSAGPDSIPSELLKHGGESLHQLLHELICEIWKQGDVPHKWKDALLITIYKNKGDKSLCGNSRGIALLSTAGKILTKLMLRRLVGNVSEELLPETQCGFRSDRSTVDMVFVIRQLFEKCREQHQPLYVAFIDLSKAFDSVDRSMLWTVLKKCGCPPKFINILRQFHEGMTVRVKIAGSESEPFEVSRGVKQGCVLAPVLFNIYIQVVTRLLQAQLGMDFGININYRMDRNLFDLKKLKARTKISRTGFLELQYADDCALVTHSAEDLQSALSRISLLYAQLGLCINVQKTEVMHFVEGEAPPINIEGIVLKEVSSFKYLGSFISNNCKTDDEIHSRVSKASSAFGRLRARVFSNHDLKLSTKIKVYNAVVLSALLYCSEAWTPYRKQIRVLEAFHIGCLQRILDITWRDRVPHSDILKKTNCQSIEAILHRNRLRWLGHVIRMPDHRLPKQMLYGELSEGARSVGGQFKRYRDVAKQTLKVCNIQFGQIENTALDRAWWSASSRQGVKRAEEDRHAWLQRRRDRRHRGPTRSPSQSHSCATCGRICASRIGLLSHERTHQGRREAVIVGPDGQP